jgi:Fic family protein
VNAVEEKCSGEIMLTLERLATQSDTIPATVAWAVAELSEARGKQELFKKQSPQRLKVLREHALIESAVSSNRIEGVEIDPSRVDAVIRGRAALRDRDEGEVRGYRDALNLIHTKSSAVAVAEETILQLHALAKHETWDAGAYKERDGDIIEKYPNGRQRVRFRPVSAQKTPAAMTELIGSWKRCLRENWTHPLVALASFNLDFLCIHPFRDGNGRVSRLLMLLQSYQLGFEVGRYISLERLIEENKDSYYEALLQSSDGWHEGKADPWPYVRFVLYILRSAFRELEHRVGLVKEPRGAKAELVESAILSMEDDFNVVELERVCPGVSRDHIRRVLKKLRNQGKVECLGRGPGARWHGKKGRNSKRGSKKGSRR